MTSSTIRNETTELRLLFEVVQALEGVSAIGDQLQDALTLMARHTGMMRGTLSLLAPNGRDIVVEAAYGLKQSQKKLAQYVVGEGVTGKVIETGTPMVVPQVSESPLFLNRTGARDLHKEEISFICVPIMLEGRAVGALSADRLFADSVSLDEDMRLLRVISSLVARAVKNRLDVHSMQMAVVEENRRLQTLVHGKFHMDPMVGSSAAMQTVVEEMAQVANSGATVLLRGESGTGKELVASLLHANSSRAGRAFVKVNCAALPENLVESELFGYERGAFTGAVGTRKGRFEMAHGGTLFLDEVGDMTQLTQAKLLRAIQEREFERVGGTETLRVDVRLVAATNRDLEAMVSQGTFRQDLYYRLCVFPILLPPLRERRDDIMALTTHFIDKLCAQNKRTISSITPQATRRLVAYGWPGNIRELENAIERAIIICGDDGVIDVRHLPPWLQHEVSPDALAHGVEYAMGENASLDEALNTLEKRLMVSALEKTDGNMLKAAGKLGITTRIMGLRMKKHGLDYREFR